MLSTSTNKSTVFSFPSNILRIEGFLWFLLSLYFYHYLQASWWLFAILFFAPDVSLVGYKLGPKKGAIIYNAFHSEIGAFALAGMGVLLEKPTMICISIIWLCHISFDRMLGIGLKYAEGFKHTHLGVISFRKLSKK